MIQDKDYFDLHFKNLNEKIDGLSQRVSSHDKRIEEVLIENSLNKQKQETIIECITNITEKLELIEKTENLHIVNCPQNTKLKTLQEDVQTLKDLRSFKHSTLVMTISIIIAALSFLSLVAYVAFNTFHKT